MQFHGNLTLALPHFIAGLIGLAAGVVALAVLKGGPLHRKSGMIFAYAMLLVAVSGIVMATVRAQKLNLLGGLLTFYMVPTALATVRRRLRPFHWTDVGALLLALTIGVLGLTFGIEASNSASGRIDGLPPTPAFMFGAVALLAAMGDIRMMLRSPRDAADRAALVAHALCFLFRNVFVFSGSGAQDVSGAWSSRLVMDSVRSGPVAHVVVALARSRPKQLARYCCAHVRVKQAVRV